MRGSFYKAIGFVVWKGGKWYLLHRVAGLPSRKVLGAAVVAVGVGVGAVIAVGAKRDAGETA